MWLNQLFLSSYFLSYGISWKIPSYFLQCIYRPFSSSLSTSVDPRRLCFALRVCPPPPPSLFLFSSLALRMLLFMALLVASMISPGVPSWLVVVLLLLLLTRNAPNCGGGARTNPSRHSFHSLLFVVDIQFWKFLQNLVQINQFYSISISARVL